MTSRTRRKRPPSMSLSCRITTVRQDDLAQGVPARLKSTTYILTLPPHVV
ncbi:unnamed protein product [Periconia digitata]|uniref:Uncharacterized protein n=1 Tax=Periconia digitata TaxID=1303443 RepID=A0A9W4USK5_9PLEO|nr:unnamed protein product [Periconia digitata]